MKVGDLVKWAVRDMDVIPWDGTMIVRSGIVLEYKANDKIEVLHAMNAANLLYEDGKPRSRYSTKPFEPRPSVKVCMDLGHSIVNEFMVDQLEMVNENR